MQALWPVGAVAGLGAADCAYLTYSKVTQVPLACPVDGGCTEAGGRFILLCDVMCQYGSCTPLGTQVLNSSYASIGPLPLSALGLVAYLAVVALSVSPQNKDLLYWLCLTMALSSLGLTGILIFVLQAPCPYCAASAFISAMLLTLVEYRRARDAAKVAAKATIVQTNEAGVASVLPGLPQGLPGLAAEPPAPQTPEASSASSEESEAEPRRAVLGLSAVLALGALRGGTLPTRRLQNAWAYFTRLRLKLLLSSEKDTAHR